MNKILQNLRENWITYGFETLVVVVGILGSLSLNNWNEERKNRSAEQQYLRRFLVDVKDDVQYYDQQIASEKKKETNFQIFQQELLDNQQSVKDVYDLLMKFGWENKTLAHNKSTYDELISTGQIDIISTEEVKLSILNYYAKAAIIKEEQQNWQYFSRTNQVDLFRDIPSLPKVYKMMSDSIFAKNIKESEWLFFNDTNALEIHKLQASAASHEFKAYSYIQHFTELKRTADELIVKIENQLENE